MASLKEIKERIRSVGNTEKITNAMRMISSAKLTKAQKLIDRMRPYERSLNKILSNLLSSGEFSSPLASVREFKRVAIVVVSAETSFCGAFNANVIKRLDEVLKEYIHLGRENIDLYPIGRKIVEHAAKVGYKPQRLFPDLSSKPRYGESRQLSDELINNYITKRVDRVILIYHRFRTVASADLVVDELMPMKIDAPHVDEHILADYIIEPDAQTVVERLLPRALALQVYTMLLDSAAAEHAARMIAMQTAGDNANQLLEELNLQYNKSRQQAITNELLDIIAVGLK